MLSRRLVIAAATLLMFAGPLPANADPGGPVVECSSDVGCFGEITDSGNPGAPSKKNPPPSNPALGNYDPTKGCYYKRVPIPPGGRTDGGYYQPACFAADGTVTVRPAVWLAAAPVGPTPEELARRALATIRLDGAQIGFAPNPNTGPGLVGLPVWMWTTVTPNTWGPISDTATDSGLSVTITAQAVRIDWDMGDGNRVTCTTPGTPYRSEYADRSSPDCGHRYLTPSTQQPGGKFTVVATTLFQVPWQGGDQSGVLTTTRTSQTLIDIDEAQVVNR